MTQIKCRADHDRVRTRSTQKQIRKGLLARLGVRGIVPNNASTCKLDDLRKMIDDFDINNPDWGGP